MSVLKSVLVLCYDKTMEPIVYNCHKESIFHHKSLLDQQVDHSSIAKQYQTHFKTSSSLSSCETHLLKFFTLLIFLLWSDIVEANCLRNLSETLTHILCNKCSQTLVVNCGYTSSNFLIFKILIPTTELL